MQITPTSASPRTVARRWLSMALWMLCLHSASAQETGAPLTPEPPASEQATATPAEVPAQPTQQASPVLQQHKGSSHAATVPYIHEGMNYYYARRRILKDGWKPIRADSAGKSESLPPEVDACGNTNNCNIYFYKGRKMLAIMTYGDYFPHFNSRRVSRKDRKQYPVVVWFKIFARVPILDEGMAYADARRKALALGWKLVGSRHQEEQRKHYTDFCTDVPNPPSACSARNAIAEIGSCSIYYRDKSEIYYCNMLFKRDNEWFHMIAIGNPADINTYGEASRLRIDSWFYDH